MKASQGVIGRVFILRLEDGDIIPGSIETFAADNNIATGHVFFIGGAWEGQIITGPRYSDKLPPDPIILPLDGAHEVVGIGLLTSASNGKSNLHIHASLGRSGKAITGCLREGIKTWLVGEVIIYEINDVKVSRKKDPKSGFDLLSIDSC